MMMMGGGNVPVSGGADDDKMTPYLLAALQQYLPSNDYSAVTLDYTTADEEEMAAAMDKYASDDEFRMYDFKVRQCIRACSHDWTECPFAHPEEKVRRRDRRKYHYSGAACPDFRKAARACASAATPASLRMHKVFDEEPVQRVDSGWALRAKVFERLSK